MRWSRTSTPWLERQRSQWAERRDDNNNPLRRTKNSVADETTTAIAGRRDTYTIVAINLGPSDVTGALVSDNFPSIFTGVTFTARPTGGASGFTASGTGNINDTVTMPAGSRIRYTAVGTISSSATGTLSNTVTVTAPNGVIDPILTNNSATDIDTIR
jgi:uncharacterized repeat protein (TIGR01451 family)